MVTATLGDLVTQLEQLRLDRKHLDDKEAVLLDDLRKVSSCPSRAGAASPHPYGVGDKTLISNKVGHVDPPRRVTIKDRACVVVDITPCRVHVKTVS